MRAPNHSLMLEFAEVLGEVLGPSLDLRGMYSAFRSVMMREADGVSMDVETLLRTNSHTPLLEMIGENILYMEDLLEKLEEHPTIRDFEKFHSPEVFPVLREHRLELLALPQVLRIYKDKVAELMKEPEAARLAAEEDALYKEH